MSQVSLSQQLKEGNLFAEQCPSREVLKHCLLYTSDAADDGIPV